MPRLNRQTKRRPVSSAAAQAQLMASEAAGIHLPPDYLKLTKAELPFWRDIMLTRAREMWTEHDLIMAHELARIHYDIAKLTTQVRKKDEQRVKEGKINPLHRALKDLQVLSLSYTKTLQIHPRATQGESEDQRKRNGFAKEARKKIDEAQEMQIQNDATDEDLIPRPSSTIQ